MNTAAIVSLALMGRIARLILMNAARIRASTTEAARMTLTHILVNVLQDLGGRDVRQI